MQEVSGGTTAADLGLAGINVAASQADGQDIVQLFAGLDLAQLNDGAGVGLRAELPELEIAFQDGSTLQLDLDPTGEDAPRTLGDIVDRLNAADPARLQAALSADGERIVLTDLTSGGGTFTVTNPLGGNVAEELGLTDGRQRAARSPVRASSPASRPRCSASLAGGAGLGTLGSLDTHRPHRRDGHRRFVRRGNARRRDRSDQWRGPGDRGPLQFRPHRPVSR